MLQLLFFTAGIANQALQTGYLEQPVDQLSFSSSDTFQQR